MKSDRELPLKWPQFTRKTEQRVIEVLRSGRINYWTGDEGRCFEREFAEYLGVRNAISVGGGTAALQIALEALGVGKGDDVVVTPYSFRSSATCAALAGANPVFADVGPDHMLTAETIAAALTPRTKAVVVVHLYGLVAEMGPILRLAKKRGIYVVEDCAQCLGGKYRGKFVGTLGDAGCFSFSHAKHITAGGEGGMIVTRSKQVADEVRSLRDLGWVVGSEPKVYDRLGHSSRLTEIQSAVARTELERLDSWNLPRRRMLAEALLKGLSGHPLVKAMPVDTAERRASFWVVPLVLDASKLRCTVLEFIDRLQKEGALAYKVLWPLMAERPKAKELVGSTVGFWVHPTYTLKDIARTVAVFKKVAKDLTKQ